MSGGSPGADTDGVEVLLVVLAVLGLAALVAVRAERERVRDAGVALGLVVALALFAVALLALAGRLAR